MKLMPKKIRYVRIIFTVRVISRLLLNRCSNSVATFLLLAKTNNPDTPYLNNQKPGIQNEMEVTFSSE